METMFVEARYEKKIILPFSFIKRLPEKIGLFTTVQFMDSLRSIKEQLEQNRISVTLFKTKHTRYPGQILGCNISGFPGVDAYVYIGDGMFHPKALVIENNLPVYSFNPLTKKQKIFTAKDVEKILKKEKGAYIKFLSSGNIGVLVTLKYGQNQYKRAKKLENKYPDKVFYYLVSDTIDFAGLANFNFIESFVNTACPRIGLDDSSVLEKPILNIDKLL
ncbi:MAG: 2-(3-amino-3-carboxypropyl)histidine synthase subunit [Nanoarchaeota archaeon]|nr:2-(3-amino-3-carboxypropyl)histidine synthase subunit [Nanoarchaeota archaeon]